MKYVKAQTVLPDSLLTEIQKYIQGQYLYIPIEQENRKVWGQNTGTRAYISERNKSIRLKHSTGASVADLAEEFMLSVDSIKKIVYKKQEA